MKFKINKNATNEHKLDLVDNINKCIAENQDVSDMEITINTKRTLQENSALHKYYDLLSEEFNNVGLDFQTFFTKPDNLIITPVVIKEFIWRPVQKAMFGKKSTKELTKTGEINKIYDVINKKLSNWGIYVPFPDKKDRYLYK